MRSIFIGVFLCMCYARIAYGQGSNIHFSHLSVENGLSQSAVMAVFQDSRGFIWLGTQDGLNKYNSIDFLTYRHIPADSLSLPGSLISEIFEDRKGNIWIGTTMGLAVYLPDLDVFKTMPIDKKNNLIGGMEVTSFLHDEDYNLWVGTTIGLFIWKNGDPSDVEQVPALPENKGLTGNNIQDIFQDNTGAIWVGTTEGLCRMKKNPETGFEFHSYSYSSDDANGLTHDFISFILADHQENIWVGTRGGLNKIDTKTDKVTRFTTLNSNLINDFIRDGLVDQYNDLWIGTYRGLCHFKQKENSFVHYVHDPDNPHSLSDNSIHSLYRDKKGTIWIGTYFGGVNLLDPDNNRFNILTNYRYRNSVNYNVVSAMIEDDKGNIWIGTEGRGLNYFDRRQGKFHHYLSDPKSDKTLFSNNIKSLFLDHKNNLWIGTYRGGLNCLRAGNHVFDRFFSYPSDVFSIFEDKKNKLWIGTFGDGLWTYDSVKQDFVRYDQPGHHDLSLSNDFIRVIFEDSRFNLWVGTQNGLNVRFNGSGHFEKFVNASGQPGSLSNNLIYAITEDSNGNLWIGTYGGGLNRFDMGTKSFRNFSTTDGLPGNNIFGILEDQEGNLWLSTNNGLSRFNPVTGMVLNFDVKDRLPGNEFNFNSHLKTRCGELFFGSKKGLVYFRPENIKENHYIAPIVFTGLKLFHKPVRINSRDGLLTKDISLLNSIVFTHKQNVFTIDFALLSYLNPQKNRYAYKLEGLEEEWNYATFPSATYTNLNQGSYKLLVKAANNDGVWTEAPASFAIEVLPPPWKTWWAYVLYFVALVGLLLGFANFIRIRTKLEHDLHMEHLEKERDREIHQMKLQFFTNISHEIRTPLTLIMGPLQNILEKCSGDSYLSRQLTSINNNAERMLRLLNQLMDLRKQETGNAKLTAAEGNIVKFVREIKLSFQEKAIFKKMDYDLVAESDQIRVWYDRNELEKVFFNLLSNAFKYTPDGGRIRIILTTVPNDSNVKSEGYVKIEIEDNGIGIPSDQLEKIFERFYQVDKAAPDGSGIGLALSKGIVELHHGKIKVRSREMTETENGKTVFTVLLPLGCDHLRDDERLKNFSDSEQLICYLEKAGRPLQLNGSQGEPISIKKYSNTLLIVEDNAEIRNFIQEVLSERYKIYEASNGMEGWNTAVKKLPDIIISDVIMPKMDGIELCRMLKTDERTSHIPVILLTARTALIHKVNGYETGADDYLTKPFDIKLLEVRIKNLIESRTQMRRKFGNKVFVEPSSVASTSTDEKFLNKLISIIETNINDEAFNVASLAREIGMSQPVLFRKIKMLTNMNIADFIKSIRLKKAATLLQQKELSVSEVATEVGYNDPKYFSKIFKSYFGKLPSHYAEG